MAEPKAYDLSVLYVEDEEVTRDEIAVYLRRRVRRVFVARNGEEGLGLFRKHQPELVITDIRMPVMDGLEMARTIRRSHPDVQVIVTTAHSDSSYLMNAIDAGIDRYVLKPVDAEKLSAALEKCAEIAAFRKAEMRHREERERLIGELQAALSKVKLLSGFLPICASCKKIRDDKGYWQQIEAYIRDHSEAEFSHAICPECAKRIYPEFYKPENEGGQGLP